MRKVAWGIIISLFIFGCTADSYFTIKISHTLFHSFENKLTQQMLEKGNNTIVGYAFLEKPKKELITCANKEVFLIPNTAYSHERMVAIYGNCCCGYTHKKDVTFNPENKEYLKLMKKTTCSKEGKFVFENIKDGSFFVTTQIPWKGTFSTHKGNLMRRVELKEGKVHEIVLTHECDD